MDIVKITGIVIFSLFLILVIKQENKTFAILLSMIMGILLMTLCMDKIVEIVNLLNKLVENSGINKEFLKILLKIVGITYIIELGRSICLDAGENSLALKLEMAGKITIASISIPIISNILTVLSEFM